MKENNHTTEQMSEKDLDNVIGGGVYIKFDGVKGRQASRHIVHPNYLQIVHPNYGQSKNGKPLSATDNDHKDW
jgi:bacteriocin-like protein